MKRILILLVVSLSVLTLTACSKQEKTPTAKAPTTQKSAVATKTTPQAPTTKAAGITGKVTETMNAAGYTYVQVDDGQQKVWAAAPEFKVTVGDEVIIPQGMPMKNYHSNSLNRDFNVVYFVDSVLNPNAPAAEAKMPKNHPSPKVKATVPANIDLKGIIKAKGGMTVDEINTDKAKLAGKEITLRAKVVKYNAQIMGKNWLHVQDGSGNAADGTSEITLTTTTAAKVGDTVLITGKVTLDKDFGAGYKYALIIEDAKVTVE